MNLNLPTEFIRDLWIKRQGLAEDSAFGKGKAAALKAIEQIGYAQIDTIFVIERAHHHILWSRVPDYRPQMLHELQTKDKAVFEYWTHALSYIPTRDFPHFVRQMKRTREKPSNWYKEVTPTHQRALLRRIKREGALSMRQIEEEKKEKDHEWASTKPSKRVLEYLFYSGKLTVSQREGMLKHYELIERHFGWKKIPKSSSPREEAAYRLDRALNAQGVITLESASYLERDVQEGISGEIKKRLRSGALKEVKTSVFTKSAYVRANDLELTKSELEIQPNKVSILSPFDPLVIQRKRTSSVFGFDYLIECYVPEPKRKFGYFSLPILVGSKFVARLDLKAERESGKLLTQSWHWEKSKGIKSKETRTLIEEKLEEFAKFQFNRP